MKRWGFYASVLAWALAAKAGGQDFFELPPIRYSATASDDKMARFADEIRRGEWKASGQSDQDFLRSVLRRLDVPEESQVLVFSKTSLQNSHINRLNPRALYFSMDAYVGWVPGGKVEVIIEDEKLGPVFYTIDPPSGNLPPRVVRATDSCLRCHATSRTEGVPGMFVRSVVPDENSHAILSAGTSLVTDETDIRERWGGWYVSGSSGSPHLGNRWTTKEEVERSGFPPRSSDLEDLSSLLRTEKYLQASSDVVALMVLEHQCRLHNLLTKAKLTYQRACYFEASYGGNQAQAEKGMAWKTAENSARDLVKALLFENEARLGGDGIESKGRFAQVFESRGETSARGRSLRDLRLYERLFKYRCSYMIHSSAFRGLPELVKSRVFHHLRSTLEGEVASDLGKRERQTIFAVLSETVPGFKKES